jgi:CxxC motif-containing protein (DUF1111 family)
MNRLLGYLVLALVALIPVGVRAITWKAWRHQPVDPVMADAGQTLFNHKWTPNDPLANGGDGLGPVYNADSCVACHSKGGVGGSGGLDHNVTNFSIRKEVAGPRPREGVIHAEAVRDRCPEETLALLGGNLPRTSKPRLAGLVTIPGVPAKLIEMPRGVHLSQRNTPALFGDNLIDEVPDREIIANERRARMKWGVAPKGSDDLPVGRALHLPGGRIGHFGWKAQSASLSDFVRAACANELGLGNPSQAQPRPLSRPDYRPIKLDLTDEQCDQITAFVASLPRPEERLPGDAALRDQAQNGKKLFATTGCADCHTPDVGSVQGIYSDLLLHRMGEPLEAQEGGYNDPGFPPEDPSPVPGDDGPPSPGEWRTPPLWGVADSGPYLHDGRAATLEEAIRLHGGQAARAAAHFNALSQSEQGQVLAFLKTLRAP